MFDTHHFNNCANSGASSCATTDKIDFITGIYKHMTAVTINRVDVGLKVKGCRSVCWILQDDKRENIEIII